jgi:hypothetical protein
MKSEVITIGKRMVEFRQAYEQGISGIVRASEIYVQAMDADPRNGARFHEQFADLVPASVWANFEAIGRRWMHPRLIMGGISDRRKNSAIKKLPYSLQERVFNRELVPVAIGDRVEEMEILSAPPEVVEAVCDTSGFRNVAAQRAYLKAKEKAREPARKLPYIITNGKIYFAQNALMSKEELLKIIAEM